MEKRNGRRLHGRRGLKFSCKCFDDVHLGRRLHGRRGLKLRTLCHWQNRLLSPPSRAAWIEIPVVIDELQLSDGRRLHGRRGLKYLTAGDTLRVKGRRLHGRRGLKSF